MVGVRSKNPMPRMSRGENEMCKASFELVGTT
jgi:hypothetical protein